MRRSKLNSLEIELASSILYYDLEEMSKFFTIFDAIISDGNIPVDGTFVLFVSYLKKWFSEEEKKEAEEKDPEKRKASIVDFIRVRNKLTPNARDREIMDLWMDKVLETKVPMELAEDILYHFIWHEFKKAIEIIDKTDVPFSEKLSIRPKIPHMLLRDGVVSLSEIELEKKSYEDRFITGVPDIDKYIRLEKGGFAVVAARPGVGKSLFMIKMGMANALKGIKCLYLSIEMNKDQLHQRIINYHAGENVKEKYLDEHGILDFEAFESEVNRIKSSKEFKPIEDNLQLYVTTKSNAESILADIEEEVKYGKYEIIFIDYLQLLRYSNQDEWSSIRTLTNQLKKLASRLGILIVTGSQVSRTSVERGLYLQDLFGSSSIEADTDVVIGLEELRDRKSGMQSIINIKLLKNRDGDITERKCLINYGNGQISNYRDNV